MAWHPCQTLSIACTRLNQSRTRKIARRLSSPRFPSPQICRSLRDTGPFLISQPRGSIEVPTAQGFSSAEPKRCIRTGLVGNDTGQALRPAPPHSLLDVDVFVAVKVKLVDLLAATLQRIFSVERRKFRHDPTRSQEHVFTSYLNGSLVDGLTTYC